MCRTHRKEDHCGFKTSLVINSRTTWTIWLDLIFKNRFGEKKKTDLVFTHKEELHHVQKDMPPNCPKEKEEKGIPGT